MAAIRRPTASTWVSSLTSCTAANVNQATLGTVTYVERTLILMAGQTRPPLCGNATYHCKKVCDHFLTDIHYTRLQNLHQNMSFFRTTG